MLKRTTKVLIGKAIARTASLDIEGASFNLKNGEIFVADGTFKLLSAGATYADSNFIVIGEGTGTSISYNTPDGTAVTGVTRIIWSDPIDGAKVRKYNGTSYTAATQEIATVSGSFTPVIGTEYAIRITFTHLRENPSQASHTFRVTATTAVSTDLYDAFAAKINATEIAKVSASHTTNVLTLTGVSPVTVDSVNAIDEFYLVNFEVSLFSDNFTGVAVAYTQAPSLGQGDWRQVRDVEKLNGHDQFGFYDNTAFPIIRSDMRTVSGATYDTIVIENDHSFIAPTDDVRQAPKTTIIYLPASAGQTTDILAVLNPWMASLPAAFSNISL